MNRHMAVHAHELDVVELRHPAGRWPAGTLGTVVDEGPYRALVEVDEDTLRASGVSSEEWLTAGIIDVPYTDLAVREPAAKTAAR
jgi:hypothetical protein